MRIVGPSSELFLLIASPHTLGAGAAGWGAALIRREGSDLLGHYPAQDSVGNDASYEPTFPTIKLPPSLSKELKGSIYQRPLVKALRVLPVSFIVRMSSS